MAQKKKKVRKPKGYSRVDSAETNSHGWLVRIKRGDTMRSRFLSDMAHGGKTKSRDAASKLYEQWTAEMPSVATSLDKLSVRNATGVVGVHFSHDVDERFPNCAYESYIASWLDENGKRTKLGFSCNKYGEDAFELACIAREKRLTDREQVLAIHGRRSKSKRGAKKKVAPKLTAKKKTTRKQATKKKAGGKKPTAKKKTARKR